tara:strand:- start:435 stop:1832 length:1398 start_codon:yes stop_codon:yes gene_type:complete
MEAKIAVVGDLIFDRFKYYKSTRLSPEGPAPIIKQTSYSEAAGGAGNVAVSLANLGCNTDLIYSSPANQAKDIEDSINNLFGKTTLNLKPIQSAIKNPIPIKIRYYVDDRHFMREDQEDFNEEDNTVIRDDNIINLISSYDIIVLSDYRKGTLSSKALEKIIEGCNKANKPLFIDTKITKSDSLRNAFCLKINRLEFNNLFTTSKIVESDNLNKIKEKINEARDYTNISNLIVTLGSQGSFCASMKTIHYQPASIVEVVDITGAGDAFLSAIVYSFLRQNKYFYGDSKNCNIDIKDLTFANEAAASVVSKKGTMPLSRSLIKEYTDKKRSKLKVGFTNGCFDIFHIGHLSLLKQSKEECDYLIVGLNSDKSVQKLKGDERPINDQKSRLEILESIKYVDEVRIFDEDTPEELIYKISPDVLIKGEDYEESQIIGSEFVKSYGGKVVRAKLYPGISTSKIISLLTS